MLKCCIFGENVSIAKIMIPTLNNLVQYILDLIPKT